jgi:hypothetical protein
MYSFITYLQFRQALAQRLYDAGQQFITDAEAKVYTLESLQTFNALANFYRDTFVFNSRQNVTWYDLTDTTNLPNTLRPLTTTVLSILQAIEYHLLEPQTSAYPLAWSGSKQFAITDLLNAIQQVRDQCLSESNCTISQALQNAAITVRTTLADTVLEIRRVCWIPTTGLGYTSNCLLSSDVWAQQSFEAGFPQAVQGYPLSYRRSTNPPLSFDVDIVPAVPGNYDILTVNAGTALSTIQSSVLSIPNDWCWAVKWAALAQLCGRDSLAADTVRSSYALARYKQGIAAMLEAPALLSARINDVPVILEAISNGDFYDANWQAKAAGFPTSIYYAGLNLLALSPVPDAGPYSVTASVVRNMVLPSVDADNIQIGRDDVSVCLDYAQHIAMFKVGGAEFLATAPLYQNFIRHCTLYNSKLSAQSIFREFIDLRSHEDEREHPEFTNPTPATVK